MSVLTELGPKQIAEIAGAGTASALIVLASSMATSSRAVHRCVDWFVSALCAVLITCGSILQFMGLGHGAATSAMVVEMFWTQTIFGRQPISYPPLLILAVLGPASVLAALVLPITPIRKRGAATTIFCISATWYWALPVLVTEIDRAESALYGGPIVLAVVLALARFGTIVYLRSRSDRKNGTQ